MTKQVHDNDSSIEQKYKAAEKSEKSISFFQLFKFYETKDKYLMIIGTIFSIVNGTSNPLVALLFGGISDDFGPGNNPDEIVDTAGRYSIYFLIIGICSFIASYLSFGFWMVIGERQAIAFRKAYFKALIRQEIAFFDALNPNEFQPKLPSNVLTIKEVLVKRYPHSFSLSQWSSQDLSLDLSKDGNSP